MPRMVEPISCQAHFRSTSRQFPSSIVNAIEVATMATSGVAVFIPSSKANRGMAMSASPKPNADRMNVETKITIKTRITGTWNGIRTSKSCDAVLEGYLSDKILTECRISKAGMVKIMKCQVGKNYWNSNQVSLLALRMSEKFKYADYDEDQDQ